MVIDIVEGVSLCLNGEENSLLIHKEGQILDNKQLSLSDIESIQNELEQYIRRYKYLNNIL